MKKIKDILTISIFAVIILAFCAMSFLIPDSDVSYAERRKLSQTSDFSSESVFSTAFSEKLETYLLDQFPARELMRKINARVRYSLLKQKDVNGLWLDGGSIFKKDSPLDEKQVLYGTNLINSITKKYLGGMNVYYSVIPEKNYFLEEKAFDYDKLLTLLDENIEDASYIDVLGSLELSDYYKTDTHWSQDKIFGTLSVLAKGMGMDKYLTPENEYKKETLSPFYGVYWGQAALSAEPDELVYMTSKYTDNAKVYGIDPEVLKKDFGVEDTLSKKVYATEKFGGMDGYDVFLSGAQPIVTIECENAKTERELVIFRDSFSSSLAPLFAGAYKKVTLVDLRYIPSALIGEFVEFNEGQDALFLYSNSLYNSSMLLK